MLIYYSKFSFTKHLVGSVKWHPSTCKSQGKGGYFMIIYILTSLSDNAQVKFAIVFKNSFAHFG